MPNELYLLVRLDDVKDVFDEIEAKDAIKVMGAFLDLDLAIAYQEAHADLQPHGTRLCVFGYNLLLSEGFTSVLVVVDPQVN